MKPAHRRRGENHNENVQSTLKGSIAAGLPSVRDEDQREEEIQTKSVGVASENVEEAPPFRYDIVVMHKGGF